MISQVRRLLSGKCVGIITEAQLFGYLVKLGPKLTAFGGPPFPLQFLPKIRIREPGMYALLSLIEADHGRGPITVLP
jgi:hypothetical protein